MGSRSIWQLICSVIGVLCLVLTCFSTAFAYEPQEVPESFKEICDAHPEPDAEKNGAPYVIWDLRSKRFHSCAPLGNKDEQTILDELEKNSAAALIAILDSRQKSKIAEQESKIAEQDSQIPNIDSSIYLGAAKVKGGQKLKLLSDQAYKPSDGHPIIFGLHIAPSENETTKEGYVFIPSLEKHIKKGCFLGLFSDGYFSTPKTEKSMTTDCFFLDRPVVYFNLVPIIQYPTFSIGDASVTEGGILEFEVTKEGEQSLKTASFSYEVLSGGVSEDDYDIAHKDGAVVFDRDEQTKTISIRTIDDATYEPDEIISVRIFDPFHSEIKDDRAEGIIENDDLKPPTPVTTEVMIDDATAVTEGENITFQIRRIDEGVEPFSLNYELVADTATDDDFDNASGRIEFAAKDREKFVLVETYKDELYEEGVEQFMLRLSASQNVKIRLGEAIGTINDGVPPPCGDFSVEGDAVNEGETLEFKVSREELCDLPVTVEYQTYDLSKRKELVYVGVSDQIIFGTKDKIKTIKVQTKETDSPDNHNFELRVYGENNGQNFYKWATGQIINTAPICKLKPNITSIDYARGAEGKVRVVGKACPGSKVFLAGNDQVDESREALADRSGRFEFESKTIEFFPYEHTLALQVVSVLGALEEGESNTAYIIGDEITSFTKPQGNCPRPDHNSKNHSSLPLIDGLSLQRVKIIPDGLDCFIEVEVKNDSDEDAVLTISYNDEKQFHIPKNTTQKKKLKIKEQYKSQNVLPVGTSLLNGAKTKIGEDESKASNISERDIRKALDIHLSHGSFLKNNTAARPPIDVHFTGTGEYDERKFIFKPADIVSDSCDVASNEECDSVCLEHKEPTLKCAQSVLNRRFKEGEFQKKAGLPSISRVDVSLKVNEKMDKNGESKMLPSPFEDFGVTNVRDLANSGVSHSHGTVSYTHLTLPTILLV